MDRDGDLWTACGLVCSVQYPVKHWSCIHTLPDGAQFQPKQIFRNSVCADFFDVPHVLLSDWTGTWTDGDDGTVARNFDSLSSVPDFA